MISAESATIIGTGVGVVGFIYMFFRNFKQDINTHIDGLSKRMDTFEARMISMDEKIFFLSTGRSLQDAMLAEKMKENK